MDIKVNGPEPTAAERDAVDAVLGPPVSAWSGGKRDLGKEGRITLLGGNEARAQRHLLLPALHGVQDRFGWLPPGALAYLANRLTVPPADVHGVATFYHLFTPGRCPHPCPCLRRHRLPPSGRLGFAESIEAATHWIENGGGTPKPLPGAVRTGSRGPGVARWQARPRLRGRSRLSRIGGRRLESRQLPRCGNRLATERRAPVRPTLGGFGPFGPGGQIQPN